ncbi:hypothetical protein PAAG_11303 [Paracoccidioides lutzii Pb01]|uniref:Uncharacterized protein n=1 Tax=Paracoccidioides lutzii (strain ATCC MYA-826 / Pb01) TaxID=502779 RepID=A0A0A2V337_PARBA|nr:hypothetical protein PAAG_11303 [Paracoccidioides lutzii Pb01]KGQ01913.1 hypothetical protein PAAG_11303 [Paracoccidioides lutzii Pb01]
MFAVRGGHAQLHSAAWQDLHNNIQMWALKHGDRRGFPVIELLQRSLLTVVDSVDLSIAD